MNNISFGVANPHTILRLPDLVEQKYEGTHKDLLKDLEDKTRQETQVINALKSFSQGQSPVSQTVVGNPGRTMASPEWEAGCSPINLNKRLALPGVPTADFDAGNEWLGFKFRKVLF